MDAMKFGLFIAELRKEKHLTQVELAGKINVTDKAVSRWERGVGFPDISLLQPLADALGISVLELMKSERIKENSVAFDDADNAVSDTIKAAEYLKKLDLQKEKQIIYISAGLAAVLSVFVLLIDNTGWNIENIIFTGLGTVIPLGGMMTFIVLFGIGIFRHLMGKPCKRTLRAALVCALVIVLLFISLFVLGLFVFPGQS
ncbi:MAG: helix-turn-helix domain-containing protein [Erysipelotrichaceae bacterium]